MKKPLSVLLLYLTILCAACCTEPEPTTITLLSIPLSAHIGHGEDTSTPLEKIAFTFLDLDGDGADELLLGWHDTDSYDMQDGYVFAVYRLADDVPTFCFEGWERNRYQICSDHSVYLSGSAGASYTTYEKLLFRIMYNKGPSWDPPSMPRLSASTPN